MATRLTLLCLCFGLLSGFVPRLPAATPISYKGAAVDPTRILVGPKKDLTTAAGLQSLGTTGLKRITSFSKIKSVQVLEVDPSAPLTAGALSTPGGQDPAALLESRIEALKASGNYEFVEPDYIVTQQLAPTDTAYKDGTLWGLHNTGQNGGTAGIDVNAASAWNIETGSSQVIVAVIDSGVNYHHLDLIGQMWQNPGESGNGKEGNGIDDDGDGYVDDVNGIDAVLGSGDPDDVSEVGHGTHCAGTIGANANNSGRAVGMNWNVSIMACRFIDSGGTGRLSDELKCFDYAISKGSRVLNCSFGMSAYSNAQYAAVEAAAAAGVLVVGAAGNDGTSTRYYPAGTDLGNVLSVAAIDRTGALASFSNYGTSWVQLAAPGVDIYSTYNRTAIGTGAYNAYITESGTSMATPYVAGAAALLFAHEPGISVWQARERIVKSAKSVPLLSGYVSSGGMLDAAGALTLGHTGPLSLTVTPLSGTQFLRGVAKTVHVGVRDSLIVANATVTGTVDTGPAVTFHDDGIGDDDNAGDGVYAGAITAATSGTSFDLVLTVTVPGKTQVTQTVTYQLQQPPENDDFARATPIQGEPLHLTGTNVNASVEVGEPRAFVSESTNTVWWRWTPAVSGRYTVSTTGSTFDTRLAVYTGASLSNLFEVGHNDDGTGLNLASYLDFTAAAGTTYYIQVDGYNGQSGTVSLTILGYPLAVIHSPESLVLKRGQRAQFTVSAVTTRSHVLEYQWYKDLSPIPGATQDTYIIDAAQFSDTGTYYCVITDGTDTVNSETATLQVQIENDRFADAPRLEGQPIRLTASNVGANSESGEPYPFAGGAGKTIWWSWTPSESGRYSVSTGGSSFDTRLAVYTGTSLADLIEVGHNDDGTGLNLASYLEFTAAAGTTYYIQVDGYNGQSGTVSLTILGYPLSVIHSPENLLLKRGQRAQFTVSAATTRSHALEYQWYKDLLPISGATQDTYVIDASQDSDNGSYFCRITDGTDTVDSGTATLQLRPANDDFADATVILGSGIAVTGSNTEATGEEGEPYPFAGYSRKSVWWKWTPDSDGNYLISTRGSTFDTVLTIYDGETLGGLVLVGGNDDDLVIIDGSSFLKLRVKGGHPLYIAVDSFWSYRTGSISLSITRGAPFYVPTEPTSGHVRLGANTTLAVTPVLDADVVLTYQWYHGGILIPGATGATYTISQVQASDLGDYYCEITADGYTSRSGTMTVTKAAHLVNLSARAVCGTGDAVMIPGFVISGGTNKKVLLRAVGPTLGEVPFNVPGALADPTISLYHGQDVVAIDDDWDMVDTSVELQNAFASAGAFPLPLRSKDSALLSLIPAGAYTTVAQDTHGQSGVALLELYDLDGDNGEIVNMSNRGYVGAGDNIMIAGFVISEEGSRTLLIRAVGPTLGTSPFNVTGVLADPILNLYRDSTLVDTNDNWMTDSTKATAIQTAAAAVGAFPIPDNSLDAALLVTLPPGAYTVHTLGANAGTGNALVEIYLVP